jgi:hypothetical protein
MHRSLALARQFFLVIAAGALLMSVTAAPATATPLVSWRVIHGIVRADDIAAGLEGALIQWTTMSGSATVDLGTGSVQFNVIGLTVAQGFTVAQGDAIGTTDDVTQVFGTISCPNGVGGFNFSFTQAVPLSPQGDGSFSGPLSIPISCTPSNISFFITTQGTKHIEYIAFGASRFTH